MPYNINLVAATYNCGAYGGGGYDSNTCTSGTSGTGNSSGSAASGGILTNTGFDILLAATLACVIIFMALLVRFWKRPRTHELSEGDSV